MTLTVILPLRTPGPNHNRNRMREWMKMKAEHRLVARSLVADAIYKSKVKLVAPLTVKMIRFAPGQGLDDDNLRGALKHVRDGVADALGYADDQHADLTWDYHPAKGEHQVVVEIQDSP